MNLAVPEFSEHNVLDLPPVLVSRISHTGMLDLGCGPATGLVALEELMLCASVHLLSEFEMTGLARKLQPETDILVEARYRSSQQKSMAERESQHN